MKSTLKLAIGVALAYAVGIPALALLLLYVDGSNSLLFDCIVFWLRRLLPVFHFGVERGVIPIGTFLSHYANLYLKRVGYESAADVLENSPVHHVVCFEIVTFTNDLTAYYKRRVDTTDKPLCSNGDHSNVEETLIIIREHFQKIAGAVLTAVFLSAFVAYMSMPSSVSAVSTTTTPVVEYVPPTFDEVFHSLRAGSLESVDSDSVSVETVYSMSVDSQTDVDSTQAVDAEAQTDSQSESETQTETESIEPDSSDDESDDDSSSIAILIYHLKSKPRYDGLSIADARKAMRADKEASAEQSAAAILAAVRRRIQRENAAADEVEVVEL